MDNLTPEQRHKAMSRIKTKNTSIELKLRKALWRSGVRYRKNYKSLPGTPDIAITKYRIAVFCDGELFHGKDFEAGKMRFDTNKAYWEAKIKRNMARDQAVDAELQKTGWTVLRFWGKEITRDIDSCVESVLEITRDHLAEMGKIARKSRK
ncbi:MAG: very short patch repair endonuclease [Cloacibacillus sp.]